MFTLSFLYVTLYLTILLSLMVISFVKLPIQLLTEYSSTTFMLFIQKYSTFRSLWFALLLSLTGLPPLGLFFVKFNILIFVLYQVHIVIIFFVFFFFFLNMIYYTQLFNSKNHKSNLYIIVSPRILKNWYQSCYKRHYFSKLYNYKLTLQIVNVLIVVFLFIFIFNDLLFILALLAKFKCQQ